MPPDAFADPSASHPPHTRSTDHQLHAVIGRWGTARLLVAAGAFLPIVTPLIVFGPGAISFLGPMLVPSLVALILILVWRRAWTYLTAAIVGTLFPLLALVMFGIIEGFFNALDTAPYIMFLIMALAIVLLWTGGIAGFQHARQGRRAPPALVRDVVQRAVILFLVGLLIGASATSFAAADRAISTMGGGFDFEAEDRVTVTIQGFEFHPQEIVVKRGVITEIHVENRDRDIHTFTYINGGTEYDHEFLARQSYGFLVLFTETGTHDVRCRPHVHEADGEWVGMTATIRVID